MPKPTITSVAILGSGDMGSAVARSLSEHGLETLTCLDGRSEHSRRLALAAGMQDTASLAEMISRGDVLLSIMPPAAATDFANRACPLIKEYSPGTLFVDCNAVSPQTSGEIAKIAAANDVRFQDVGIVGAAPQAKRAPVRFYTSGAYGAQMQQLATEHIRINDMGDEIGRASAIKMVYASVTKATNALRAAAVIAAERLGVSEEIHAEWQDSLPGVYEAMQKRLPLLSADAGRWSGEMHEIANTYQSVGLTPAFHEGAAWLFDYLAATDLGTESKLDALEKNRSLQEVVDVWLSPHAGDRQ
jgi:3-hydroxyisobutyrate dehydrogenase-like beta-hydroxyacid dehydrogenase